MTSESPLVATPPKKIICNRQTIGVITGRIIRGLQLSQGSMVPSLTWDGTMFLFYRNFGIDIAGRGQAGKMRSSLPCQNKEAFTEEFREFPSIPCLSLCLASFSGESMNAEKQMPAPPEISKSLGKLKYFPWKAKSCTIYCSLSC